MLRPGKIIVCLLLALSAPFISGAEIERVSLVTCGPGTEVYELEGHTALRLQFDDGQDLSVNWGTFDFNSPNFLYRFVKGETDYRMAVYPFVYFYDQYRTDGRWMKEQELLLTQTEKQRLVVLIDSTLTRGSPVYRYNYVLDNCATRPVDYVEMATGAPVILGDDTGVTEPTGTFREDMIYYHSNFPWYQFGIDLALGSGIDRPISSREHYFAPVALTRMLGDAYLAMPDGTKRQLAAPAVDLLPATERVTQSPTPWPLTPMFVCWAFFAITFLIAVYDYRRRRVSRWFYSFYYTVAGIAGLLLTFLIFVSVHESTSPNWLYLWLNPLCFIGVIFVWLKKLNRVVFWWQIVNFVAIIALGVLALCGVQRLNPAFIPLMASDALLALLWISLQWPKNTA